LLTKKELNLNPASLLRSAVHLYTIINRGFRTPQVPS
jgi:hypothetical protein